MCRFSSRIAIVIIGVICTTLVLPSQSFSAESSSKRKQRRVRTILKSEGYYCSFEKGDRIVRGKSLQQARTAAESNGYLTVAQYCAGSIPHEETTNEIQPGQNFAFNFSFDPSKGDNEARSSALSLLPGIYRLSVVCSSSVPDQNSDLDAEAQVTSGSSFVRLGDSYVGAYILGFSNSTGKGYSDQQDFPLGTRTKGVRIRVRGKNCYGGTLTLSRLS